MGKVKTEHIKRLGQKLMSNFPEKFSSNFDENKRAVDALTVGATTKLRNQVAGYITHSISLENNISADQKVKSEIPT